MNDAPPTNTPSGSSQSERSIEGAYFRFGQDEGLPSLLKTVRGRLLILTAAINVLWWAVAYEVFEDYASDRLELVIFNAACLFPTIFIVLFAFIFDHFRIKRRWLAGSFAVGLWPFWRSLQINEPDIGALLLSWPLVTLLFSFIIYRLGLPARFPPKPPNLAKPWGGNDPDLHSDASDEKGHIDGRPIAGHYILAWILSAGLAIGATTIISEGLSNFIGYSGGLEVADYNIQTFAVGQLLGAVVSIGAILAVYGAFKRLRPKVVVPWMLGLGLFGVFMQLGEIELALRDAPHLEARADEILQLTLAAAVARLLVVVFVFHLVFRHRNAYYPD